MSRIAAVSMLVACPSCVARAFCQPLWDLLKGWVRLKETTEYDEQCVQIKKLAPRALFSILRTIGF